MKKNYTYIGKDRLIFSSDGEDFVCLPGKTYDLNSGDEYIQTLIALGYLKESPKAYAQKTQTKVDKPVETKDTTSNLEK